MITDHPRPAKSNIINAVIFRRQRLWILSEGGARLNQIVRERVTDIDLVGQILAEASRDRDELVTAELDLDKVREVRNVWQFYRDRRPETYSGLCKL